MFLNGFYCNAFATGIVTHSNHANELDDSVQHAMSKLRQQKITVLNQTVLLKGINDNVEAFS